MTSSQAFYPGLYNWEDNAQFIQTNAGYYPFDQDLGDSMSAFVSPSGGSYHDNPIQAPGYPPIRQHGQPLQQLRVDTEFALRPLYDSATSSSTPFSNCPPATPWQLHTNTPFIESSSPASAPAVLQKGILSLVWLRLRRAPLPNVTDASFTRSRRGHVQLSYTPSSRRRCKIFQN
ncbi:hypothetical protein PAXRUDRAFT_598891 [Paxillus rubicundulus Ve08.2h10]|uniref:Uncharacterized protein n=1 Tax=Paxillus rubicundulus Ve08.2h10 TaxID=930991 RepID=A0A0D0DP02_9AGAM|nr:hypothetical protein PAXRUDRAFT_598891 [Paxillus rubicundulus Ve08.2h10]